MQKAQNNLTGVRAFVEDLAQVAGQMITSSLTLGIQREWKSDQTPVTEVDKSINQMVIDAVHREFPDHSILAEEGSDLSRSKEYVWVCDPIDGTFPFMHAIPVSTFTLALVHDGQPIFGLIYDPFMKRMFVGEKGKGTTLNGKIIHPSKAKSIKNQTIGVVFWKGNMDIFAPLLDKLCDHGGKIMDLCSMAYMDALVASGELGATIFPGLSAHDSAAAKIVIEEAGGIFTSLTGEIDRYDAPVHGHISAANQDIYDQIISLLR
jgi:myo-inositol-1(or 4)-monophosphatase